MIDLHTHTTYSDGTDDIITLLQKAQKAGIECLSITDHITCKAYEEIKNIDIKKYYTGKLIVGCEFFTAINGQTLELLGYNLDPEILEKEGAKIFKYSLRDINVWETEELIKKCKKIGIKINEEDLEIDFDHEFGTSIVYDEIKKYPENEGLFENKEAWNTEYIFYRECICNSNSKFFVNSSSLYPTPDEVIEVIKKANGLVFIPHIFVYGENSMIFFNELINNHEIDGIECYYSLFTDEQTKFLVDFCEKNNLYISGGSDYHGLIKPDISLGIGKGNLNIPNNIVEKWYK